MFTVAAAAAAAVAAAAAAAVALAVALEWCCCGCRTRRGRLPPVAVLGSSKWPLVATLRTAHAFAVNPLRTLLTLRAKYGDVFTLNLILMRPVFVQGAVAQREFYKHKDDTLSFEQGVGSFIHPLYGANPYTSARYDAAGGLGAMIFALQPRQLRTYADMISKRAHRFFNELVESGGSDGVTVDLVRAGDDLITTALCEVLMGTAFADGADGRRFTAALRVMEDQATKAEAVFLPSLPTRATRRAAWARREIFDLAWATFRARFEPGGWGPPAGEVVRDWIDAFWLRLCQLDARGQLRVPGGRMQALKQHVHYHWMSLAIASHTNTASTFVWTLAHLLDPCNKHALDEVLEEQRGCAELRRVSNTGGADGADRTRAGSLHGAGPPTVEQMPILERAMKEAVRLHAPCQSQRKSVAPAAIGGYDVPAGRYVVLSPMATHRHPDLFTDPSSFDPDRFLDRDFGYAFSQFGFGQHKCVGYRFAHTMLLTTWSTLLQNYEVKLARGGGGGGGLPPPNFKKIIGMSPPSRAIPVTITRRRKKKAR